MTSLSKIIKSSSNAELPGKVISVREILFANSRDDSELDSFLEIEKQKILNQFQQKSQEIIREAEQKALLIKEQIEQEKAQWIQEKQAWIEEAKKVGYEEGLIEGRNQGFEEYHARIEEANQMVNHTKNQFVKHIEESEKIILDLGIMAAEKIICESLEVQPEKFLSLVKQAIKEVREYQEIKIIVHPSRYPMILSRKDELDSILAGQLQCYIYGNEQFTENQCVVETENGRIDVSIDSQLNMLHEKLLELLEGVHA